MLTRKSQTCGYENGTFQALSKTTDHHTNKKAPALAGTFSKAYNNF
jgi:hypothetical protein